MANLLVQFLSFDMMMAAIVVIDENVLKVIEKLK